MLQCRAEMEGRLQNERSAPAGDGRVAVCDELYDRCDRIVNTSVAVRGEHHAKVKCT